MEFSNYTLAPPSGYIKENSISVLFFKNRPYTIKKYLHSIKNLALGLVGVIETTKKRKNGCDELQRKLCRGQFDYLLLWDDGDPDLVDQVLPFGLQKNCCIHHTHLLICKEQRITLTLETTTQQEGEICFPALNVHYTQLFQPFTEFQN